MLRLKRAQLIRLEKVQVIPFEKGQRRDDVAKKHLMRTRSKHPANHIPFSVNSSGEAFYRGAVAASWESLCLGIPSASIETATKSVQLKCSRQLQLK